MCFIFSSMSPILLRYAVQLGFKISRRTRDLANSALMVLNLAEKQLRDTTPP